VVEDCHARNIARNGPLVCQLGPRPPRS
jgi:hypothetical protein